MQTVISLEPGQYNGFLQEIENLVHCYVDTCITVMWRIYCSIGKRNVGSLEEGDLIKGGLGRGGYCACGCFGVGQVVGGGEVSHRWHGPLCHCENYVPRHGKR